MKKIHKKMSITEQTYDLLRQSIVSGELSPDQELREEKIAKQIGVSRTPLRDALRRLSMDGLVVLRNGKPAKVATFTMESSLHLMEIRTLLETHNLRTVTPILSKEIIEQLRNNVSNQRKAVAKEDYETFFELDRDFHLLLTKVNRNKKLQDLILQMNSGDYRAFIILSNTLPKSADAACDEHESILEAVQDGGVERAVEAMNIHMDNIVKRITQ
ncbi:DNA-binding transcriptional regulator, GntR family [Halobacillus dabanensis]|uniref:DNA-binding transcriptional regulator, GntR family n=1 Tax=Halobacillus dabanensis TaxID=240302 RepID=A0A1I3UYM2_HALDA|nr:GntR family transcriptional regulator [Halobacillus dabanensis]SFJ88002.1 DNA-binding transcriptional regulator, GntR family [Halobacillus dabanensis]